MIIRDRDYLNIEDTIELVKPYIFNTLKDREKQKLYKELTSGLINPKFKLPPKNKKLYRGIRIKQTDFEKLKTKDAKFLGTRRLITSFTTSSQMAKQFAIGGCGLDLRIHKCKYVGIVYCVENIKPEDILLSIGSLMRKCDSELLKHIYDMKGENEFLINTEWDYHLIKKSDIVYTSNSIRY